MECKETAYICKRVTEKSLVLIDELGRATSNEDGISLAWSVAEHLLSSNAFTFFVTHYAGLNQLQQLYSNVNSVSFGKIRRTNAGSTDKALIYDHKLVSGECKIGNSYGIDMAEMCGWPDSVVAIARMVREVIVEKIGSDGTVRLDAGLAVNELEVRTSNTFSEQREALFTMHRATSIATLRRFAQFFSFFFFAVIVFTSNSLRQQQHSHSLRCST